MSSTNSGTSTIRRGSRAPTTKFITAVSTVDWVTRFEFSNAPPSDCCFIFFVDDVEPLSCVSSPLRLRPVTKQNLKQYQIIQHVYQTSEDNRNKS